ncbi:MAG TPA: hypothetical protein VKB22_06765 [Gemmatimonadales bacterium]|nr:hypothetical protein [Gemmatimonadales bacterium]
MTFHGNRPLLAIVLSLGLGVGCTSADLGPSDPPPVAQFGSVTLTPTVVTVELLQCNPQRYVSVSKVVGPKGARIKVGTHSLEIPAGALSQDVTIVAEQVSDVTNSVRFSPEGLTFAQPAELTMSYDNCFSTATPKRIVYTTDQLNILEQLRSDDRAQSKTVTSPIEHFSRYAVAY